MGQISCALTPFPVMADYLDAATFFHCGAEHVLLLGEDFGLD